MYSGQTTIGEFLKATGAKQPTPGGGAVAALAGALAAAMGEMVLNYSVSRKSNLPETEGILRQSLVELSRARDLMLELMREDQAAYDALTAARKMPDGPEKTAQVNVALLACIRIPQTLAACGLAVLEEIDRIWELCNIHLLSDLAICAELAMATVRGGVYNVRANLPSLTDAKERLHFAGATEQLLARATAIVKRNVPRIWERHRMES